MEPLDDSEIRKGIKTLQEQTQALGDYTGKIEDWRRDIDKWRVDVDQRIDAQFKAISEQAVQLQRIQNAGETAVFLSKIIFGLASLAFTCAGVAVGLAAFFVAKE